ncbi:MAG: zinc-binding dehydrogenase [Proteobacteria bacterium]|nr:zinc-binding dehydrogenase [Pseudomonadota bacterium]NDG25978.1 zinc-binding dehydrogenase [Pseudomonadota bacterium]
MSKPLNTQFKCIEFNPQSGALSLATRLMPDPRPHEVVIKVWGSPINPSDRLFCQGLYGTKATQSVVPGFEGSGTVVKTGTHFMARRLMGKRVSGAVQGTDGFWAEYVVLSANQCLPVAGDISDESASCSFVNPLSAWALFEPLRRRKFSSFVQTAAASQLGKMVIRLSKTYQVPGIHIVHRAELVEAIQREGAECVLDSSHPHFESKLKAACEQFQVRYAIDAVAGEMTGILTRALLSAGKISVYGVLSGKPCLVEPGELIFRNIQVNGFWLSHYIKQKKPWEMIQLFLNLKRLLKEEGVTHVARRLSLIETIEDINGAARSASQGKTLVMPSL